MKTCCFFQKHCCRHSKLEGFFCYGYTMLIEQCFTKIAKAIQQKPFILWKLVLSKLENSNECSKKDYNYNF